MIAIYREWSNMNASDISALESLLQYFDTYAASQAMAASNQLLEIYPNPADYIVTFK